MNYLQPTLYEASVTDIDQSSLERSMPGLGGIMFDLDKTLVGQHEATLPEAHLEALITLNGLGLKLGIISNASSQARTDRVLELSDSLSDAIGDEVVAVTSRMVGGKKKPLSPIFDLMSQVADIPNERLCYVGDQIFKDILGANRAGYGGTVLVAPYGQGDDPRVKYLQRPLEAAVRPFLGLPLLTKNF